MNRDLKAKWIDALTSGEYPQTLGTLHRITPGTYTRSNSNELGKHDVVDAEPGYCCLGVLCDVLAKEFPDRFAWDEIVLSEDSGSPSDVHTFLGWEEWDDVYGGGYHQKDVTGELEGIRSLPGISIPSDVEADLINLNDGGASFAEIAELIAEAVPVDDDEIPAASSLQSTLY